MIQGEKKIKSNYYKYGTNLFLKPSNKGSNRPNLKKF